MSLVSRSGGDPHRWCDGWATRVVVMAVVFLALGTAAAGEKETEAAEVKSALEKLDAALEKEQGLNPDTKAALRDLLGVLDTAAPASVQGTSAPPQTPPSANALGQGFLQRLDPYGDVRVREEYNWNLDDADDLNRIRVRLRLGTSVDVGDGFSGGVRAVAGDPDDPRTTNQSLGNIFNANDWNFDRAFVRYDPMAVPGLMVEAGKFEHPFFRNPVHGNTIWDSDVNADGFLGGYLIAHEQGMLRTLSFYLGEYLVLTQGPNTKNSWATVAQAKAGLGVADNVGIDLAMAFYIWHDLDPDGSNAISAENRGNELDANGNFAHDFLTIHKILALHMLMGGVPLTTAIEFGFNARTGSRDLLYGIGVAAGKKGKKGDWRVYYNLIVVEQNSIVSVVATDETLIPVNSRSHITGASYNLTDNVLVHIWVLASSRLHTEPILGNDSRKLQKRARLDLEL